MREHVQLFSIPANEARTTTFELTPKEADSMPLSFSPSIKERSKITKPPELHLFMERPHAELTSTIIESISKSPENAVSTPFATHSVIQSVWSLFGSLDDQQRNTLLRGLLSRCSSRQIEFICTCLSLKVSEAAGNGQTIKVQSTPIPEKFQTASRRSRKVDAGAVKKDIRSGETSPEKESFQLPKISPKSDTKSSTAPKTSLPLQVESEQHQQPHVGTRELHKSHIPTTALVSTRSREHAPYFSENIYIKLLNSSFDMKIVMEQIQHAGIDSVRAVTELLAARCKKLENIMQKMRSVVSEANIEDSLRGLMECSLKSVEAHYGCLYVIDPINGEVLGRASNWVEEGKIIQAERIFGSGALLRGEMLNTYTVRTSDLYTDVQHEVYGQLEPQCILSVPITSENSKVIGILEVINKSSTTSSPYFSAEDEFMLRGLGSMYTIMLNHSHIKQQALRKSDDIRILLNTASLMSSELELDELIRVIMQTVKELLHAERCSLFMVDREKQELWSSVAEGAKEIRIPMKKGIAGHVASTGETLNIANAYNDKRFNRTVDLKTGFKTRNILCMAMRNTQGQIIGVTQVINKLPESFTFTKDDEMLLMAFSSLAAVTIEKSILFKAIQSTLNEANETKNFLTMILQSISNVVMTLDAAGRLVTINHPEKLGLTHMVETMKATAYDYWLGRDNQGIIMDIQKAYKGEQLHTVHDYELIVNGKRHSINYSVVKMTGLTQIPKETAAASKKDQHSDETASSASNLDDSDESATKEDKDAEESSSSEAKPPVDPSARVIGVVIVLEVISSEKRVMNTLGRYMNPKLVHQIMADGGTALNGTRQLASVLFANLRGFTTLSHTLDPVATVSLLNQHYSYVVEAIIQEQGILDKYIGDSAMALYGVPYPSELDAVRAIASALKMMEGLREFNNRNKILKLPLLYLGIGISTGPLISGSIGSAKRLEYTAIGDSISVASRVEAATKIYSAPILVCEHSYFAAREHYQMREIDSIVVKNRIASIYEVLGHIKEELPQDTLTASICYELGLAEYRAQNWSVAMTHFKKGIQISDDGPSKTMFDRCKAMLEGEIQLPPVGVWDLCWPLV